MKIMDPSFATLAGPVEALSLLGSDLLSPSYRLAARFTPAAPSPRNTSITGVYNSGGVLGSSSSHNSVVAATSPATATTGAVSALGPSASVFRLSFPRGAAPPPCTTILLRIDTLESHTHAVQAVGYALLPLFRAVSPPPQPLTASTRTVGAAIRAAISDEATSGDNSSYSARPLDEYSVGPVVLNGGAFQLPLHQAPPSKSVPLTGSALLRAPRVPCCTLLVRIVPHAASSMVDVPTRASGGGHVLTVGSNACIDDTSTTVGSGGDGGGAPPLCPPPDYSRGVYDSSMCRPTPAETALYPR